MSDATFGLSYGAGMDWIHGTAISCRPARAIRRSSRREMALLPYIPDRRERAE